ncbi:Hsp20/alpha crystallin family protein [Candidatus Woesearchaeota archaeon]|mgnify:CR=1 FL=1|jgi:HSP20 family molecular chaperone IbpA|nr:Hsp20/alpha crystallin family protein [Candidatus Woesearchaeota archaeon]MBT6045069.1 Hsp20/alpha crystallin family protein [Candidatus Woesearchaeota archaeon]
MVKRGSKRDVKFSVEFNTEGIDSFLKKINKKKDDTLRKLGNLKKRFSNYEEPFCEIRQNHKKMRIEVKLPDVKKKDVLLNVSNERIEIKAEAKERKKLIKTFHRVIDIPKCSLPKKIKANFKNNVLKLDVPFKI